MPELCLTGLASSTCESQSVNLAGIPVQRVEHVFSAKLPASNVRKANGFCSVYVFLGAELGCEEPAALSR